MRVVAIVQARMGSTRLPGKVLMDAGGETVLSRVIARLSRAKRIDEIVIATTKLSADDAIVKEARRKKIESFRGSEQDVLDRYCQAAAVYCADIVVRITADCPLIDSSVVDDVIEACLTNQADLACNELPRSFPRGLDTEVFTTAALLRADEIAKQPYQREHVTPVFYERQDMFHLFSVSAERDYSQHRWTLDTAEDLELIRAIYSHFDNKNDFGWRDSIALMERLPYLATINAHVVQKPVCDSATVH
jgi:spore coat polysaccharide biosynthesis protein SpsF